MILKDKKILIGICGSIAAYKTASLVRLFIKAGAQVRVVMTKSASEFITPLTLATLSKNPVHIDFVKNTQGQWANHVEYGLWADLFIIAPISANTISKFANGNSDNLLTAIYLSSRCDVMLAPAMDLDMFNHPSTQNNISKLKSYGNIILSTESGELASGLIGSGRMLEPEKILDEVCSYFEKKNDNTLKTKKILITAGPTYEAIDPVRFIGNHSSGKMGYALAEELAQKGADVILVSGPTSLDINNKNIKLINVTSANEMLNACLDHFNDVDAAILSAAVADYTPKEVANHKIKKQDQDLTINLTKTTDILAKLGSIKSSKQILVGFALETNNEEENARKKIQSKNLDFIVLNSMNDKGAGFKFDTNKITIINKDNSVVYFELKTKTAVAKDIVNHLINTAKW